MELEQIHDMLMDSYIAIRQDKPLTARLILGNLASLIRTVKEGSPELEFIYGILHAIRVDLKKNWGKNGVKEVLMEHISQEIRKVYSWCKCAA